MVLGAATVDNIGRFPIPFEVSPPDFFNLGGESSVFCVLVGPTTVPAGDLVFNLGFSSILLLLERGEIWVAGTSSLKECNYVGLFACD